MFDQRLQKPVKSPNEGCEIEIKKTKTGRKIKFKGNCTKEQISAFAKDNGLSVDLDD